MNRSIITAIAMTAVIAAVPSTSYAQHNHNVHLHVNTRWDECSFQLDPSLTQRAWRRFTREAALVAYFRPLADAKPMGRGNFELSVLQATTNIDDTASAWNDTFVHPDSTHWLHEGNGLPVPGLQARAGVTAKLDVGAYYTINPNANYGFYGAQAQYNFVEEAKADWSASARVSFVSLFGPDDLDLSIYGVDVVASRAYLVFSGRASISPYAGVSGYLSSSHEKTAAVSLKDERVFGAQAMAGVAAQFSVARIAMEYNTASVQSRSIKVGFAF